HNPCQAVSELRGSIAPVSSDTPAERSGGELADQPRQLPRLIQGDQRVAIGQLDVAGIWERLGETAAVLVGHHLALAVPDDEDGLREGAQRRGRGADVPFALAGV